MLTTDQKGLIAEQAVIFECLKLGVGVAKPLGDERYDIIVDVRARLLRIQCKWAVRAGEVIVVRTRRCRRTGAGLLHRSYGAAEIDAIAAYCPQTGSCYLLPHELSVDRAAVQLRLGPTRNNQTAGVRWARDYEFAATLTGFPGP